MEKGGPPRDSQREQLAQSQLNTHAGEQTPPSALCLVPLPSSYTMGLCLELRNTGTCTQLDCQKSHDTSLFCEDCNILCDHPTQMESHLQGARHMKVLRNRAAVSAVCWVCNMTIGTNATLWAQHLSGKRHIENTAKAEPTSGKAGPPNSNTWCNVCSARLQGKRTANAHRSSEKHKKKVALLEVGGRIKDSQQSKHGVALSHESGVVEIPFVDIQTLVDQPLRTTDIVIAARSRHCRLTSVRFLSSGTSVGRQSS